MIEPKRIRLFVKRYFKARYYGFSYRGTTKTKFPRKLCLAGESIALAEPMGNECVYDLFNVLLDDEYGLKRLKKAPSTIVDIGVNMGIFSIAAAACYPSAKIFGYEPNAEALEKAAFNLRHTNVSLKNEAVGKVSGMCEIESHVQSRLVRSVTSDGGTIPVVSLAEVVKRAGGHVDLLKMDCEGAEWEILEDHESLKSIASIRMEYHLVDGRSWDDFESLVCDGGHKIVKMDCNMNHGIVWLEKEQ